MARDDGYTRYTVRIPTPLYERVKKAAGEKSVNAEIVATLHEKYPPPQDPDFLDMLEEALKVAPNEVQRFLIDILDREIESGKISEQDIKNGLIPGVVSRPKSDDD